MRVVMTGHTGVRVAESARTIAKHALGRNGILNGLDHASSRRFIRVLSVEEELKRNIGDLRPFLELTNRRAKLDAWRKAFEAVLAQARDSDHTILCLHSVYFRQGTFSSCVDWDLLSSYEPTIFITLIDDIFDAWQLIRQRDEHGPDSNSRIEISDLLAWRSAEISATQTLAENLLVKPQGVGLSDKDLATLLDVAPRCGRILGDSIPHFTLAVKHPVETFYRLLFKRELPVVYASFPISRTRDFVDARTEIETYLTKLHSDPNITVLNPLTIDELRVSTGAGKDEPILRERWDIGFAKPMLEGTPSTANPFEGYDRERVAAVIRTIDQQLVARDFNMVEQSNALVAYRPYFGGSLGSGAPPAASPALGVDHEIIFASQASKLIYIVHPKSDNHEDQHNTFSSLKSAVQRPTTEEVLKQLHKICDHRTGGLYRAGEPSTWERSSRSSSRVTSGDRR